MLIKIISLLMSAIMSVSGMCFTSFNKIIDSVSEMFFGLPFTDEAVRSDFLYEITDSDIITVDKESGFVKDMVAVFIDEDLSFSEKVALFGKTGGVLIGWSAVIDLYVIRYSAMNLNSVTEKCGMLNQTEGVVFAFPVTTSKTVVNATPDDPFDKTDLTSPKWDELNPQGSNWWLEAIHARQAWDYSERFGEISIGVVDSGFDTLHPELEGKISFPNERYANRNYRDLHGSLVAGIIGAKHNNQTGVAGVCDKSELICVDWHPESFQLWNTELAIFFGFADVVKAGAKVVNCSFGISGSKSSDGNGLWDIFVVPVVLSLMMSSLLSKGYDFVVVQSSGNGDRYGNAMNAEYNGYFASLNDDNIMTFRGITHEDILNRIIVVASADNKINGEYVQSFFSNVGKEVTIAAPGDKIYSCSVNERYECLSGTSLAAPIVTGVASLVWSVNPGFTGSQVSDIVCTSTQDVAKINRTHNYIYDVDLVDYPMVNAKLAVEKAILLTDPDVGKVSGRISGAKVSEILYGGESYTVFSDGTYSFVAPSSNDVATVIDIDGNEIGSFEMEIESGKETSAGEYVIDFVPETEEKPVT